MGENVASDAAESPASAAVRSELTHLTRFRLKLSSGEAVALSKYVCRRSGFPKPDDQLNEPEVAWRRTFYFLDAQLEQSLSPDLKAQIDQLVSTERNLGLARRMLALQVRTGPPDQRVGMVAFYSIVILGALVSLYLHSWTVAVLTAAAAIAITFITATVFQDRWSWSHIAHWLTNLSRIMGSAHLKSAAARLMNDHVLRAQDYEKVGDPARAAESVRALGALLTQQQLAISAATSLLSSEEYRVLVRPVEEAMIDADASKAERVGSAERVISTVRAFEERSMPAVDRANETTEEELFEAERQAAGLPEGDRKRILDAWLATAKEEYLNGRTATNIVRNWFDFEAFNARAVVEHKGDLAFTVDARFMAETMAEIDILPALRSERDEHERRREQFRKELFGVIA